MAFPIDAYLIQLSTGEWLEIPFPKRGRPEIAKSITVQGPGPGAPNPHVCQVFNPTCAECRTDRALDRMIRKRIAEAEEAKKTRRLRDSYTLP